jgi:uroporphyrinogen decarboxylase
MAGRTARRLGYLKSGQPSKMNMNPRQRVLKTLRRQGRPDRLPFEISWGAFTPSLMKVYERETGSSEPPEEYFDFDTRSIDLKPTRKTTDFRRYFAEPVAANATFDEWGCGTVPGSLEHFVEFKYHPLGGCKTPAEVAAFDWPDVTVDYRYKGHAERIAEYHRRGYAVTGELYQTIFERAWLMRGMQQLLMDFLAEPEMGHAICQCITDLRVNQSRRLAGLGVDVLRLGDDVCTQKGPMMSTDTYRTFLKERTQTIVRAAKEVNPEIMVFMHCDGRVDGIVEEYIDAGIDILNPVQPECNDLDALVKRFGSRISFWGGIGTQSVMPFGTPEEVTAEVRRIKGILGRDGGLLVAPTHILEPDVPWKNILAFIEAARSSGYQ